MAVHLALDVGQRTIGLAVCDPDEEFVSALYTIQRSSRRRDVAAVTAEVARQRAERLVVGLALLSDGQEGESARRARRIGDMVGEEAGVPVVYQDEHLSSFEAEERLRLRGFSGEPVKQRLDAEAARVILEDYLRRPGGPAAR